MKIVLLESLAVSNDYLEKYIKELEAKGHMFESFEKSADVATQIEQSKDADVIIIGNMPLSGDVIRANKNLKFIDVAFTGVDHVDLAAAKEMGVAISNASGYANQAVAELVLGKIFNLLRNISKTEVECRKGRTMVDLRGSELRGKTVGIVGYGAIGAKTAEMCHLLGCNIIAFDEFEREDVPSYVAYKSLEEVMSESDIVSLHCPLLPSTTNLINVERIAMMKPTAFLINAARGPVVNSEALADALNNDRIKGAGIDVFEIEPPLNTDHPLLLAKNTIVTPHIAFASDESMQRRAKIVFESLNSWISGKQINKII